jgi:hypothetical protein
MQYLSQRTLAALLFFGGTAIIPVGSSSAQPQTATSSSSPNQAAIAMPSTGQQNEFITLQDSLERTRNAHFLDYSGRLGVAVKSDKVFEDMRKYILDMYEGVKDVSSFVQDNSYVDCITIESQPSVRHLGIKEIAKPPTVSPAEANRRIPERGESRNADSILASGLKDRFGHPISCPAGTIPMRRLTLDMLARYPTLRDFFSKVPRGSRVPVPPGKSGFLPDWDNTHLHAYGYQDVDNYGGNSWLDLWNPSGDFSISQQWYDGGGGDETQTVEGGWQVWPDKYNTNNAVLFIYWTADNYNNTGCYNLDCTGFVQTNNNWHLGGTWNHYSSTGDGQWGFQLQWKLYAGNWWLFLQGAGNVEAVGYYPTSIYNRGQLSQHATDIKYGGEVARKVGDVWPQMGSGAFANTGWEYASYQNSIFYIPRDEDDGVGTWANLTTVDEALTTCYTITYTSANSGSNWGTYIYFGGPGDKTCN